MESAVQNLLTANTSAATSKNNKSLNHTPASSFQDTLEAYLVPKTDVNTASPEQLPVKESDWLHLKPADYSMEKFRDKIAHANYLQALLDPEVLPPWITQPQEGISRSTDMAAPPTFKEATGGVYRIDHTRTGKVLTYIPSYEWRQTSTASEDSALGNVYNQQTPWGFRTAFIRDGSNRTPAGFQVGAYDTDITAYLNTKIPAQVLTLDKNDSSPPAQLTWQERLVYYDDPALSLLEHMLRSRTTSAAREET